MVLKPFVYMYRQHSVSLIIIYFIVQIIYYLKFYLSLYLRFLISHINRQQRICLITNNSECNCIIPAFISIAYDCIISTIMHAFGLTPLGSMFQWSQRFTIWNFYFLWEKRQLFYQRYQYTIVVNACHYLKHSWNQELEQFEFKCS